MAVSSFTQGFWDLHALAPVAVPTWPRAEGAECADGADHEDRPEGPEQGALLHLARDLPAPQGPQVKGGVC